MKNILAACLLAASAAPTFAQTASSVATLQAEPAGKWAIEYGDFQCRLAREYSIAGKRTIVSLELEPLSKTAWLKIVTEGNAVRRSDGDAAMIADGVARPGKLHYNFYPGGRFVVREYMLDLDRDRLDEIQSRIRFQARTAGDIEVNLGDFTAAWKALQVCMTDLYDGFGIDQATLTGVAVQPEGKVYDFISPPHGVESEFAFLYWVAKDGSVDDCRLLKPSGFAAFDN